MRLILPDGNKIELDKGLPYEQRSEIVNQIVNDWNWYFTKYRNRKTEVCLEVLSSYLTYEKKEKAKSQVGETNG